MPRPKKNVISEINKRRGMAVVDLIKDELRTEGYDPDDTDQFRFLQTEMFVDQVAETIQETKL
jgi:hypothetical protein